MWFQLIHLTHFQLYMSVGCLDSTMTGVNHLAPIQEHMIFCTRTICSPRSRRGKGIPAECDTTTLFCVWETYCVPPPKLCCEWPNFCSVVNIRGHGQTLNNTCTQASHNFYPVLCYRCELLPVIVEVDRIVRPEGGLIVRDNNETVSEVEAIVKSLHWEVRMSYSQDKEALLFVQKTAWRPSEVDAKLWSISFSSPSLWQLWKKKERRKRKGRKVVIKG